MDKLRNPYLLPVYIQEKQVGSSILEIDDLKDITLDQFFKFFFNRVSNYDNWNWLHARQDAVFAYAYSNLLGFCHDPVKIRATQEIIFTFMNEKKLCEFLLDKKAPFDIWADRNYSDHGIKMLSSFSGIVSGIHKELQNVQDAGKKHLEPFINYFSELNSGEFMKNIREFIDIFEKPLELTFLLASSEETSHHRIRSFNDFPAMLRKYNNYPEGHYERTEKMRYGIDAQETKATFFDNGGKAIPIEEYSYMQGMQDSKETCCLIHIPKSFLLTVFSLNHEKFLGEFMPESHEPIKMTLRIEKQKADYYKLSYIMEEPDEDIVLDHVPEHWVGDKKTGYWIREKMVSRLRKEGDQAKGERTAVQKSLIGKTVSTVTNNEFVYQTKKRYFHHFFSKCYKFLSEDFGRILGELRYLAYIAEELSLISISTPTTFPKILPIEEGGTEIIDGINPSLLLNPEMKINVVPNTIEVNDRFRVQIITGPNQNGKSRFMDGIGLHQIMFQAGWPIFAKKAQMSPKTDLRVRYVHSGVGIMGESRFSNECMDVFKDFDEAKGKYPLFLIDEPYTGTNYSDAEKLLTELLQACSEENVTVFLTTHFHGLIPFVDSLSNGRNLHCVVGDNDSFTYKICEGSSIKSNALIVAERAGVRYESIKNILRKKKKDYPVVQAPTNGPTSPEEGDDLPF